MSSCSSLSLESISWRKVSPIALAFGIIQTFLMSAGWMVGDLFVGAAGRAASIIGFLMLLYVGGSMLVEAVKGDAEERNLNGIRNIIIGGVATSLDAFAVGISLSMDHSSGRKVALDLAAVFIVTVLTVIAGIFGGYRIGRKFGRPAEIAGGCILILIGLGILLR